MNERKILIVFILIITLTITGGVFLLSGSKSPAAISASQNAKLNVSEKIFDWGMVNMKDGNVSKTFIIKNVGTDILKIGRVKTSCHCTNAQVMINGVASPSFGMNSTSPWIGEVAPGNEALLTIVFDPAFHGPNGIGSVTRYVLLDTNDPGNPVLEFTLTANVIK